ncbi:hypothetical protein L3Q82_024208, partial [Scortum barcoo]
YTPWLQRDAVYHNSYRSWSLTMDEEVDPEDQNVNSVLAQESTELLPILSRQSSEVIMKLWQMMPLAASHPASSFTEAAKTERIQAMLEYYKVADPKCCRIFLQSICILCENIPMRLDSRLMSVAGYANNYWEQYIAAVKCLLLRKWERLSERLVTEVQLDNVWVSLRMANRGRDRPDQTPGSADRGSRTPANSEPDGDYGSVESRVTLDTFLQGCTGKVTVLVGPAGSGKTLADVLFRTAVGIWSTPESPGPIPSSYLFVLLEFRQLNTLSRPISLSELLFRHYLPPTGGDDEKRAVVDYLLSNPEQSCWVLDGYDEFHSKLTRQDVQREFLGPENPLPVADLISGLLNRRLLPGCTVVVTCRVRDVTDLEGMLDKVGQLLEWDCHAVKEYVQTFFEIKGYSANRALGVQAEDLLLSTRHLLAMSTLPALCNICCICLEYLLLDERDEGRMQIPPEGESETRKEVNDKGAALIPGGGRGEEGSRGGDHAQRSNQGGRRGNEDVMMEATNRRAQLPPAQVHIPSTLTQVYLTALAAFLSCGPDERGGNDEPQPLRPPQRTVRALSQYQSELSELSQLAWKGLEGSKILFMEEDVSQDVLEFALRTGLFSQVRHGRIVYVTVLYIAVELRREDGTLGNSYCFVHLTVQEFLAALRIMTSKDVSEVQLKRRFSLRTRWTTKSDQRTVFTDSLHLFVCGLASPLCTPALVELSRTSGGTGGQSWVQKRQAYVLTLLKNLCNNHTLTGPKILELCHCVQESQDLQLARQVVGTRPTLELRNIRLLSNDIDALAFVVNSVGDNGVGLDFGACSMESECLEVLPRCQHIHYLCFHSRKYGDKFAEKLSSILPKFTTLRKLEFCGASLTATGAASLASALQNCANITEINLSDNNLKDEGIKHIADVFNKLPNLVSVMLGRNNSSLEAVDCLIRKMSSCWNMQSIYANGMKEVTVTFFQNTDLNSQKTKPGPTISLSGGQWDEETLRTLTQYLPKFHISKSIVLNDSCSSVDGLVILTALMSDCPAVKELHIRLQSSVSIVFSGGREKPADEKSKKLCLSSCGLLPADLERVWMSLETSSDLTFLDLSHNRLGNKGLKTLLGVLPRLSSIQEINASNNRISTEGVVTLAEALCSHNSLTQIHVSDGGRQQMTMRFCPDKSDDKQQLKVFRINNSSLLPTHINTLCRRLGPCRSYFELDLSHSSLTDEAIKSLLKVLPKMTSLQRLNVSHSITSTTGALMLASCLTLSQRVSSVELRPQTESFIHFDSVKAEQASCRFTHFSLNGDNLERLLEILRQGPQLSDLDLSSNQLKDEGVKRFLDSLPDLKISSHVNLSNNSLTQQGLLDVAGTLRDNVSGVEVSVRDSRLERNHLVRLAEIVSVCPRLTKLEFKNNFLQLDWIEDFMKALNWSQRGVSVSIEECWIRSEEAVSLVCRCLDLSRDIHTIRVHRTTLHLSLRKDTELTSLSLVDCAVEGCQLASLTTIIQRCPLLTELDLSHNTLGIKGAEFLCSVLPSLPNLTSLSIGSKETCMAVVEQLSEALLQAAAVQYLNLSGHMISDTAAQTITRIMPRLRSLNLSHCVWSVAGELQLIKALGGCIHLEGLCLNPMQLKEESRVCLVQALRTTSSIHSLKLNKISAAMAPSEANAVLDLLIALEGLARMEEIELDGWRMADRGIDQLTRLLPVWTELRKISLSKNLISDQSGAKLMEALSSCRHLEELQLCSNSLGDLTAARMAVVLPSLTHITVLDISENHIGCEGAVSLSKAIICMKNLTKIHLTSVGTSELCAVAASLAHCPLMQDVGLGWNNVGDEVAVELAKVMPLCQKLTRIDLESNTVSVLGAEALLRALQMCPALQLLRLWRNKVPSSEAQRLSLMDRRLNFSPT